LIIKNMHHKSLNSELGFALYKTGMIFRREAMNMNRKIKLAPEQWQLLMAIKKKGGATQKEIGEMTLQDAPTLSRAVKRLETKGLVKKTSGKHDRRKTLITLTPEGKKILVNTGREIQKHIDSLLLRFPDKKKKEIIKLLEELRTCVLADKCR